MKYCGACKVEFTGDIDRCPLCQSELTGKAQPAAFPDNTVRKSGMLALSILGFASGACLLVMLFLGYLLHLPASIVVAACFAVALNYLLVRNILVHRPDFLRVISRYFQALLAIAVIWFAATGNLIVTTFIIPGIIMVAIVFDAVLVIVFRGSFVSGYAKYLLLNVVLGIASIALIAFNLTLWDLPALISTLLASIFLLALIVFGRQRLTDEIRKLFNT
jgi:hypothetical protein